MLSRYLHALFSMSLNHVFSCKGLAFLIGRHLWQLWLWSNLVCGLGSLDLEMCFSVVMLKLSTSSQFQNFWGHPFVVRHNAAPDPKRPHCTRNAQKAKRQNKCLQQRNAKTKAKRTRGPRTVIHESRHQGMQSHNCHHGKLHSGTAESHQRIVSMIL